MRTVFATWLTSSGTKMNSNAKDVVIQNTAMELSRFQEDV